MSIAGFVYFSLYNQELDCDKYLSRVSRKQKATELTNRIILNKSSTSFEDEVDQSAFSHIVQHYPSFVPENLLFCQIIFQNCMKIKEIGARMGVVHPSPPWDPPMISVYLFP